MRLGRHSPEPELASFCFASCGGSSASASVDEQENFKLEFVPGSNILSPQARWWGLGCGRGGGASRGRLAPNTPVTPPRPQSTCSTTCVRAKDETRRASAWIVTAAPIADSMQVSVHGHDPGSGLHAKTHTHTIGSVPAQHDLTQTHSTIARKNRAQRRHLTPKTLSMTPRTSTSSPVRQALGDLELDVCVRALGCAQAVCEEDAVIQQRVELRGHDVARRKPREH